MDVQAGDNYNKFLYISENDWFPREDSYKLRIGFGNNFNNMNMRVRFASQ